MHTQLKKFLLTLLVLALAAAPLRSSWATPEAPATATSHCAQLEMQHTDHGNSDKETCETGCSGSCCDASCQGCASTGSAIPNSLVLLSPASSRTHNPASRTAFSGRTLIPLLRPPATL